MIAPQENDPEVLANMKEFEKKFPTACRLCGEMGSDGIVGAYRPSTRDLMRLGARKGKDLAFIYRLCPSCAQIPDYPRRIEEMIRKDFSLTKEVSEQQREILTIYKVIDKSTGIIYRIDSTDSDFLCSLAELPKEEFPTDQFDVKFVTYEIDSMDEYPALVKQLFPGNNYFEPPGEEQGGFKLRRTDEPE